MKKIKGVICLLITLFMLFVPTIVLADNNFTTFSGGKTAATGDKIDFTIAIKSETEAIEFKALLKYDTNVLELINISNEESWKGSNSIENDGNNELKFTNNGTTGESSVVTVKFRVKENIKGVTTVSLEDIQLTSRSSGSEEESKTTILINQPINNNISIKSDDNTLKNIKLGDKLINGFSSNLYEYSIEVDSLSENIKISATLSDEKTAVFEEGFGPRNVDLKYGQNEVLLKVKSESGKISIYKLNIIRKDDRLVDNDLTTIIINGGAVKLDFDKSVLSYTVKTYKLEKLEIEATPSDSEAKVEIDSPKSLIVGQNKVKIIVTAVTGDKKEYNILIINNDKPTDTRLKNLSVKGLNIGFNSDTYEYSIMYDKSYKKGLIIYNTTLSDDVEVKIINNTNLKENSKVKVIVNALDGSSTSEYVIKLEQDKRINFFFILDVIIGIVLIVLIVIQLRKRKKINKIKEDKQKQVELEKTKELKL